MKKLISICLLLGIVLLANSQCTRQVMHTSGTMNIGGVSTTVTSKGLVDTNSIYCNSTLPYLVGGHWPSASGITSGIGRYQFTFFPPIDSLTLNFSGINDVNDTNEQEIVRLYINSTHYQIPSPGTQNGCDSLAVLTPAGDITGCTNCEVAGWNGTTIRGKISTLTVVDTTGDGLGFGGSLFSLFISSPWGNGINTSNKNSPAVFYPNPITNNTQLTVPDFIPSQVIIYDLQGLECMRQSFNHSVILNMESLPKGIYFYQIMNEQGAVYTGKILKE